MAGTRHLEGGTTGRVARWLAAALLLPALAACSGGGGGSDGGATAAQQGATSADAGGNTSAGAGGGGGETQDVRTKGAGGGGGFADAGEVSASAAGSGDFVEVTLMSTSAKTFTATLSHVTDCSPGAKPATPPSVEVTVTGGSSPKQPFQLSTNSTHSRPICLTVTIGGESRQVKADELIDGSGGGTGGSEAPSGAGTGGSEAPSGAGTGGTP